MISSTTNAQIKNIVALLRSARERKKQGLFVAEGRRMCQEAPPARIERLYVSVTYEKEQDLSFWQGRPIEVVNDSVFQAMADTKTPQGILALVRQSERTLSDILEGEKRPLLLLLENLQDPGNLGTILRTAEGAGAAGVLLSPDCVDPYSPKVTRATMGSLFRVPFARVEDFSALLGELGDRGIRRCAAVLEQSVPYTAADYTAATALMIGNEGNGLTQESIRQADERIRIPMSGRLESLNASVAAALLLYEARRQREL